MTYPSLPKILSVSELNRLIQHTLTSAIPLSWVCGELTNFTRAASGHWYFSLKDASAQVRCVMFRSRNQFVDCQPGNGLQVEVRATAGLFEARGEFQLQVEQLRHAGAGALFEAFERLKRQLEQEGLFDVARKRAIPALPHRVGVITSPQAAALYDVLTTMSRLMPALPVVLYPCQVQGQGAAEQILAALQLAAQRLECDTLILCRGGGSLEDLWPFNDERVARAIAASPIPVVTGIGHETDFTIADFVADLRAPTPTAAASLACPHQEPLRLALDALLTRLGDSFTRRLDQHQYELRLLNARLVHPEQRLHLQQSLLLQLELRLREGLRHSMLHQQTRFHQLARTFMRQRPDTSSIPLDSLRQRCSISLQRSLTLAQTRLAHAAETLEHLNPLAVLARGYSLATNRQGDIIRHAGTLQPGDTFHLQFADGHAEALVQSTETDTSRTSD